MSVGKRLRKWREALNLTQREAAARAGVSQSQWQEVETDQVRRLGLRVAKRIADVTAGEISLEDLARQRPASRSSTPPTRAA